MDNETTKILNTQQNSVQKNEPAPSSRVERMEEPDSKKNDKKKTSFGTRVAATAAGAALGTSAAMAADHIYEAYVENQADEEDVVSEEATNDETANDSNEADDTQAAVAQEPHHTVVEHVVTVNIETPETEAMPEDGSYIDNNTPEAIQTSNEVDDNEVHVVGVAIQDNGQGGVATLAGLQSGDDTVLVVDVESDGRLDFAIHDDNGDLQIDENEIHDIGEEDISTAQVVGAYIEDVHSHNEEAVITDLDSGNQYQITETENGYGLASIDDPAPDDNMYTASNDDMPDYMNDADTGLMDA